MGMKDRLKIVMIGAGSREFSRNLIHDLVLERSLHEARGLDVHMVDIDPVSLELMHGYARRCAEAVGARHTERMMDQMPELQAAYLPEIS